MQFNFNVNEILNDTVVILDNKSKLGYVPFGTDYDSVKSMSDSAKLSYIIDEMGKASALAQGLPRAITASGKLKHSDHRVYLLKVDNGANGEVVGLLKVGYKTLFVYDIQSKQNEIRPLCILDFYVHESKQRRGYGKILFNWMLQNERVQAHHLAIDRPSSKFLLFLAKHYQLTDKIPQLNNFVVYVNFFNCRLDDAIQYNAYGRRCGREPPVSLILAQSRAPVMPESYTNNAEQSSTPSTQASAAISAVSLSTQPRRRSQSGANKVRVDLPLSDLFLNKDHALSGAQSPPPHPRNGVPNSYKTLLGAGRKTPSMDSIDTVKRDKHHVLPLSTRRPSNTSSSCSSASMQEGRGQLGARPKRDYNYSVGVARHYSHTRLW